MVAASTGTRRTTPSGRRWPRGFVVVPRRTFLGRGLAVVLLGWARRLSAQAAPGVRFRPLSRVTLVPLADLATPWRARPFVAEGTTLSTATKANQPIRVSGMIVRTSPGSGAPHFRAVCVRCPHEGCDVDFMADPAKLPAEVIEEIGRVPATSVYICPCHNSTFKADDGERLSGPAYRGLYRFNVTAVSEAAVEIGEVEEDVLLFT